MSFLIGMYENLIKAVIDEKKTEEYRTNHNQVDVPHCNCDKFCSQSCTCRCHYYSCEKCDIDNCDYLDKCKCKCHEPDRKRLANVNKTISLNNQVKPAAAIVNTNVNGNNSSNKINVNTNPVSQVGVGAEPPMSEIIELKSNNVRMVPKKSSLSNKNKPQNNQNSVPSNQNIQSNQINAQIETVITNSSDKNKVINSRSSAKSVNFVKSKNSNSSVKPVNPVSPVKPEIPVDPVVNPENSIMNPMGVSDTSVHLVEEKSNVGNVSNFNLLDVSAQRGEAISITNKPSEGDFNSNFMSENFDKTIEIDNSYNLESSFFHNNSDNFEPIRPKFSKSDNNLFGREESIIFDEDILDNSEIAKPEEKQEPSALNEPNEPRIIKKSSFRLKRENSMADNKAKGETPQNEPTKEEKEKMKIRRQSKYTQIINQNDNIAEEKLRITLKDHLKSNNIHEIKKDPRLSLLHYRETMKNNKILKFKKRAKSIKKDAEKLNNSYTLGDQNHIGLSLRIKTNFERNKIKNLENPNNQEPANENRFVREMNSITQGMTRLKEHIHMENYNNKKKLTMNVFEDFEKQTSWQSYTTLLITDINNIHDKKEFLNATKNGSGTRNFSSTFTKNKL